MANEYVNKVIMNGQTKVDLTGDTVAPENVLAGFTGHMASGAPFTGSAVFPVTSVNGKTGDVELNSDDIGAVPTTEKGAPDGVASLGSDGKVSSDQLPTFVFSKTLTTAGWVMGSDGRYRQSVSVTGVTTTTKIIIVDVDLTTNDTDAKITYLEAWAGPSANEVTQGSGTLTFYSYELPTVAIPIFVGVSN